MSNLEMVVAVPGARANRFFSPSAVSQFDVTTSPLSLGGDEYRFGHAVSTPDA